MRRRLVRFPIIEFAVLFALWCAIFVAGFLGLALNADFE